MRLLLVPRNEVLPREAWGVQFGQEVSNRAAGHCPFLPPDEYSHL